VAHRHAAAIGFVSEAEFVSVEPPALSYRFMPQPPILTPEQRAAALQKAAFARRARAELKDDLKSGRATLGELLSRAGSDDTVGKMKVLAVLEALPGTGKVKARRLMEQVGISDTRRLQGLGAKQRAALLEAIERP
jgi:hypothetical protein